MAVNDITGDSLHNKQLSPQGEQNFEAIYGKRDYRNRPIPSDEAEGSCVKERTLPRYGTRTDTVWYND